MLGLTDRHRLRAGGTYRVPSGLMAHHISIAAQRAFLTNVLPSSPLEWVHGGGR
jgi:hypothetical protein